MTDAEGERALEIEHRPEFGSDTLGDRQPGWGVRRGVGASGHRNYQATLPLDLIEWQAKRPWSYKRCKQQHPKQLLTTVENSVVSLLRTT